MSKWITDRRPTDNDAYYVTRTEGIVFITNGHDVEVALYQDVAIGTPWMSIIVPEPYVKPRRWTVVWYALVGGWTLRDNVKGAHIPLFADSLTSGLLNNDDEIHKAAQEIANIYERTLP